MSESNWTYVIEGRQTKDLKIGRSKNPEKRLSQLQTGCSEELRLLVCFKSEHVAERELHQCFPHLRKHGEWFRGTPEIHRYVSDLQNHIKKVSAQKAGGWRWQTYIEAEHRRSAKQKDRENLRVLEELRSQYAQ